MTDYILISVAVLCFTGQFAFTKLFEKVQKQTLVTSLVMLIITGCVGAFMFLCVGGFQIAVSTISLLWALALAFIMIPYYVVGIKVLSLGSLAIYSMFMMLGGMLVPFLYGVIFLKESLTVGKLLGVILLSIFIVLQALFQNQPPEDSGMRTKRTKYLFFILCLVIFFINGMTGVIAKAHQISIGAVDEVSFTVLSCVFTAILSAVMLPICILKDKKTACLQIKEVVEKKPFGIMICIGIAAYMGSFLHLKAAANVPASIQFPLVSGGVIVLSALASALIFREKLSGKEWISVVGAFAATVLFAF